jgi:hypothetical protein
VDGVFVWLGELLARGECSECRCLCMSM